LVEDYFETGGYSQGLAHKGGGNQYPQADLAGNVVVRAPQQGK